jgi:toxin ParE1/3/4
MSARRPRIRYADEAREDIRDILVFTVKRWRQRQRAVYRAALDAAFAAIRDNPYIGKPRDDLMSDARGFVVREHIVLQTVQADVIVVLRVVHTRMDVGSALNP